MTLKEFKQLKQKYNIADCEVDDVCNFVSDLIYKRAEEVEREEPYAVNTIMRLKDAAYEAWDLINYISELEE